MRGHPSSIFVNVHKSTLNFLTYSFKRIKGGELFMTARERIVADVEPELKRKLEKISDITGKPIKRLIVDFIKEEYQKVVKENQEES